MNKQATDKRSYYQKLRDPRWQRRRLEVFEKAGFACEDCGDTKSELHAHHVVYRRGADPWDYADHELKALCDWCHQEEESARSAAIHSTSVADAWPRLAKLAAECEERDKQFGRLIERSRLALMLLAVRRAVESSDDACDVLCLLHKWAGLDAPSKSAVIASMEWKRAEGN